MNKDELRKKYIKIRKNITNKQIKSKMIFDKIITQEEYKMANVVAVYKSLATEVNTQELIEYSANLGKTIALPRVNQEEIEFYKISLQDKLEKSIFEVEEPKVNLQNLIPKSDIELVIVPGVCFDKARNRIGFGKGYYDKFLEDYHGKIIAICFEEQILKNELIPVSEFDEKVPKIITEKNIYE